MLEAPEDRDMLSRKRGDIVMDNGEDGCGGFRMGCRRGVESGRGDGGMGEDVGEYRRCIVGGASRAEQTTRPLYCKSLVLAASNKSGSGGRIGARASS